MTARQKDILLVLFLANALILCCVGPNLLYFFDLLQVRSKVEIITYEYFPTFGATRTATPLPTPIVDPGWKFYPVLREGFGISLPPSWEQFPIADSNAYKTLLQSLATKNPKLANAIRYAPADPATRFFGTDPAVDAFVDNSVPSALVIRRADISPGSLDSYVKQMSQEIGQLPGLVTGSVTHKRVKLAATEAEVYEARLSATRPNGQVARISDTRYVIVRGRDAYLIVLECSPTQQAKYRSTFEKIANSFRFLNP